MRTIRLYSEQPLAPGALITLEERPARHAQQVLRLAAGAALTLFNGDGRDYSGHIAAVRPGQVQVRIEAIGADEPESPLQISLGLGISRAERMDFALQKAVELGVAAITPLLCGRNLVRLSGPRLAKRQAHWQGIIIAACEQSGRCRLPTLGSVCALPDWLATRPPGGLLLDPEATSALATLPAPGPAVTLLVGPEGGLSPGERAAARAQGFTGVWLGPRILRTETAPLAAIAVLQARWGDWRALPPAGSTQHDHRQPLSVATAAAAPRSSRRADRR
ncbi:MAG: 16S rRNA (uracil(1498)-N(3))-methyltransferase [Chromatiaceae bacterium]|nr:MAG: 16S rRNA (uracil(1498)-N(3))-methyltransferase [Chromatiaceae bacterium]